MDKWKELYLKIKKNRIPVIECLGDYYMIFFDEVARCNNEVYDRYKYYLESDNSITSNKSKINKLRMGVELAYNEIDKSLWKDLKEFIQELNKEDIDIANKSCEKLMKAFDI